MKLILFRVGGIFTLLIFVVAALLFSVRFSDGPKGPIAGGALKSGSLVTDRFVNWEGALGGVGGAEIQFHLDSRRPVKNQTPQGAK